MESQNNLWILANNLGGRWWLKTVVWIQVSHYVYAAETKIQDSTEGVVMQFCIKGKWKVKNISPIVNHWRPCEEKPKSTFMSIKLKKEREAWWNFSKQNSHIEFLAFSNFMMTCFFDSNITCWDRRKCRICSSIFQYDMTPKTQEWRCLFPRRRNKEDDLLRGPGEQLRLENRWRNISLQRAYREYL